MKKHYVKFYSPGTMVAETTTKEIDSWDTDKAIKMSNEIKERHGALPYGFQFITRERNEKDFDSKETKRSSLYYLGGRVYTLKELENKHDLQYSTLISNMKCNGWDRVIENNNSWRWTQPLEKDDVILDIK